jgi:SOS response regulatory protein OraA/RecX
MTKVGRLFEDEKIRAVKEATAKVTKEVIEKAAEKALKQGFSVESIAEILSMTEEEVLEIQEKLSMPV